MSDDNRKRIKDQPLDTALSPGDLIIVDSEESGVGTRKFDLGTELTDIKEDLAELQGGGVPTNVRQALKTLLESAAYADTGLTDEMAVVSSWASAVTAITLNHSSISISGTTTSQLTATTTPSGGTVTWSSSDTSVATVSSSGLVTGVSNGTATITATSGNVSATCSVTVSGIATLSSISAVYTQTGTIYDTDDLDDILTAGTLVVTATYSDSSTATVASTDYTLSGTLTEGTSVITVSYGGKTTTFTVTVTHNEQPLYDWNFTQSLVDSVGGVTVVLTGCTRDSNGVNFTAASQAIKLGADKITITDKTYIIDIPSMTLTDGGTNHARLLCSDTADVQTDAGAAAFVYRHNYGWTVYSGSAWGTSFDKTTYPIDFFNNKRLKIYIGTDLKLKVSYANIGSDEFTNIGTISQAFASTYEDGYLVIGGTRNNNLSPVTISAIKIYEGEV